MPTLVNGHETEFVDVRDRGFQYGDGVFTTLPVVQGRPAWLERHLARLEQDSHRLHIAYPGHEVLRGEVAELLKQASSSAVLKIQLTRGIGRRGYLYTGEEQTTRVLSLSPAPEYPPEFIEQGVRTTVCHTRLGINPALAGLKHTNRLEQILARAEWQHTDCQEGIVLDHEGYVTEGTYTNVFLVRQGRISTPLLDRCGVSGVMRAILIEWWAQGGHPVEPTRLSSHDVYQADEVMLSNSVIGVWFVRACDHRTYPPPVYAPSAQAYLRDQHPHPLPVPES